MSIPFWKMHGAGNDFILIDDREETFPITDKKWITDISTRRTGVGCEGIILIQPSDIADFRMRFLNPDGTEVEMCGNGARCVARLAYELGVAPADLMTIDTVAGILEAESYNDMVKLHMTEPFDWKIQQSLKINGKQLLYSSVNSGVPHAVVIIDSYNSLKEMDISSTGRAVRYHCDFEPAGTNVDFITVTGKNSLKLRTYERGVEQETMACGTGIVASALIAARLDLVTTPVSITAVSGDILTVDFRLTPEGAKDVTLLGPALHVFKGELKYKGC